MRGIAAVSAAALLLSLAWADDLREARLSLHGETLCLNPPPLWDGRELWLPVCHLERLGSPLEINTHSVRLMHLPVDQPAAFVPLEIKRDVPCVPVRDLVRRLGATAVGTKQATCSPCGRVQRIQPAPLTHSS